MIPIDRLICVMLLGLALGGCATHQVRFQPWQGVPAEQAAELQRGEFRAGKDALFDAVATTLEHEPYLHWAIEVLDKANGFIKAQAGVLREMQIRVTGGPDGRSRMTVSVPRRELKTRAKIWVKRQTEFRTAYEPPAGELGAYNVVSAEARLDEDYLRSFTWRVLNDRSQVPFVLAPHEQSLDPAQATPASSPVPVDQAPAP
jgi:hypothetical protein